MSYTFFGHRVNIYNLKFANKELEVRFHDYYVARHLLQLRLAHVLAALFFLVAVSSEKLLISFAVFSVNLRLWFVVPSFILGFLLTFFAKDFYKRHYKIFSIYYVLITGLSFILSGLSAPDPFRYSFYSGLMISLIFNYTFIKQDFIKASLTGLLLTLVFFIMAFSVDHVSDHLIHVSIYILVCNFLGMFIAYTIEYDGRNSFAMIKQINKDAGIIKDHNINLEKKVRERTSELNDAKLKAEESDRLKSSFLANISHEIRTPMNSILGFADLLKEADLEPDMRNKYLGFIDEAGERLLGLIDDVIRISKIESGVQENVISSVDVYQQMELIYNHLSVEAQRKGIKLKYEKNPDDSPLIIDTDRSKFFTILSNLVKNAIKFTDDGEVVFGCRNSDSGETIFYVRDTGIGIPEDMHKKVFDRFAQVDTEDRMARQGSGLGLSISKGFVSMLGGRIWFESTENEGSCFYFSLPGVKSGNYKSEEE